MEPGSDWALVRSAWRRSLPRWHPDQGGDAQRWMRRNAAYQLLTAWYDGKTLFVPFTDIAMPTPVVPDKEFAHVVEDLHHDIGEWFYWVFGLHIAAALYHHYIRKDDTLSRMG